MHMHRAFRLAGRARGVEPERNVVAGGRRGVIFRLVGADEILEQPIAVRVVAGDDDVLEIGAFAMSFSNFGNSASDTTRHFARLSASMKR